MQFLLVFLGVFCAMLVPLLAEYDQYEEECMKETSLTVDDFRGIKQTDIEDISNEALCMIKCIQEKSGAIDGNGKYAIDKFKQGNMIQNLTQDQQDKLLKCLGGLPPIKECKDTRGSMKCFRDNIPMMSQSSK